MTEMTIGDVQKATLLVMKELDRICCENNFVYWITAGTLIGAIRHGGYIPWDDDLDIAMPRDDYEKLIKYLNEQYHNPHFSIHTFENNHRYPFYISRFCDTAHKLVFDDYNYESGCFVDIYPYDGMGKKNDYKYWKEKEHYFQITQKLLKLSQCSSLLYGNSTTHKLANLPFLLISKIIGRDYYYKSLNKYQSVFSWDESDYIGVISWSSGTYCYPKEWFDKIQRVSFNNIEVNAPVEYDKYLKMLYGDYMRLPPKSERKPHHGYHAYSR